MNTGGQDAPKAPTPYKPKVLLVDDSDIALAFMAEALKGSEYEVYKAEDGEEAFNLIVEQGIRLVVTDWVMPKMDGLELCRKIRSSNLGGYTYIIVLTSQNKTSDTITALEAGADDYMAKPCERIELLHRLRAGQRLISMASRDVAIFALAKLTESRDPETGEHLERIRSYCRLLADYVIRKGVVSEAEAPNFLETVVQTSPLHDIGKIGIPDSVLLKPSRLSDAEFAVMKQHATIGGNTLDSVSRKYPDIAYLATARDIALYHHEHYDGNGYPHGLKGAEIPLAARIMALADVYDALTSRRVYKSAIDHDLSRGIILEDEGKQFDPMLIEGFLAYEPGFQEIRGDFEQAEGN